MQLGVEGMTNVNIGSGGDADIGIGTDSEPYGIENTWESPGIQDVYLVDAQTGEREMLMERVQGMGVSLSPESSNRIGCWRSVQDSLPWLPIWRCKKMAQENWS